MSVPLHWSDGLPIGVMFATKPDDEATLFRWRVTVRADPAVVR